MRRRFGRIRRVQAGRPGFLQPAGLEIFNCLGASECPKRQRFPGWFTYDFDCFTSFLFRSYSHVAGRQALMRPAPAMHSCRLTGQPSSLFRGCDVLKLLSDSIEPL